MLRSLPAALVAFLRPGLTPDGSRARAPSRRRVSIRGDKVNARRLDREEQEAEEEKQGTGGSPAGCREFEEKRFPGRNPLGK